MTVIYVISALVLIVLFLLFLNVNLVFTFNSYPNVKAEVKIRILFLTFDGASLVQKYSDSHSLGKEADELKKAQRKKKITPEHALRLIKYFSKLIKAVINEFCCNVRLKVCRIYIKVASDDAAQTARLYGILSGAVWSFLEFLSYNMKVKRCDKEVRIFPDFTSDEIQMQMKFVLRIKPIRLLIAITHLMPFFMKGKVGQKND